MADNYYVDNVDGVSDALICGECVAEHDLLVVRPVDPELFAIVPLGCAIHVYGGSPANYARKSTDA